MKLLAFLNILVLATSSIQAIDVKDRIANRVIRIASLHRPGYWLWQENEEFLHLRFNKVKKEKIYGKPELQFQTRLCGDGKYICLEAMSQPRYYVSAEARSGSKNSTLSLVKSFYVEDQVSCYWKFDCKDETLQDCKMIPIQFEVDLLFLTIKDKSAALGKGSKEAAVRIHAPNPTDEMRKVYDGSHFSKKAQTKYFIAVVGVGLTEYEGEANPEPIPITDLTEVSLAFESFAASPSNNVSSVWSKSESFIFQEQRIFQYDVKVPPNSRVIVKQLKGKYGIYMVGAERYEIEIKKATMDVFKDVKDFVEPVQNEFKDEL